MITDVEICKDAIDAHENHLSESETDSLTINFIEKILNVEKSNLVILTEDQLHHDIFDSQFALFKMIVSIIERSISFAVVFDNHDNEDNHALSRE
jgi:NADH:ubiquinone oxidoreductase subunit K